MLLFLFFLLQTYGLEKTSVTNTALYTGSTAIITPFIAYVISRQKIKMVEITAGMLLIIALFINNYGSLTSFNQGDLLVLLSAFMLGLNVCVTKKYITDLKIMNVTLIMFISVTILSLLFMYLTGETFSGNYDFKISFSFLYLGILTTTFAFMIQNQAVFFTSESKISFILATESIWGVVSASFIYGETLTVGSFIALGLIMLGFALINDSLKNE